MLQYATTIRVSIELLLTVCTLWWTIRSFVMVSSEKDRLLREEDDTNALLNDRQQSIKKMEGTSKKIEDKIIPGQMKVMAQLIKQIEMSEIDLRKSGLLEKVDLYTEVKQFYTEQPDSRYFRASSYAPKRGDS